MQKVQFLLQRPTTENSNNDKKDNQAKTVQELDREKLEKKFSTEDKEKLN
jgi:small subunit ribosomal protein S2